MPSFPKLLLACSLLFLPALLSAAPPPKTVTPTVRDAKFPPHQPGEERSIKVTQVLREPGVYDFNFKVLRWKGKGKCNQKEGQAPMFDIKGKHIVLRNA